MKPDANRPADDDQRDPVQEVVERFLDLQSQGKPPDTQEFVKQYPGLEQALLERLQDLDKIETLFESVLQVEDDTGPHSSDQGLLVGQQIGDFKVIVTEQASGFWSTKGITALAGLLIGLVVTGIGLRTFIGNSRVKGVITAGHRLAITLPEGQSLALSRSTPLGWAQPAISLSPDGKQMVIRQYAGGKADDILYELDTVEQVSTRFGEEPKWSPTSNELFYRNGDQWMVVTYDTEPVFKAGPPRVFVEGAFKNVPGYSYEVMPNGKQLLVLQPEHDDSNKREINVVLNWFDEIKRVASAE